MPRPAAAKTGGTTASAFEACLERYESHACRRQVKPRLAARDQVRLPGPVYPLKPRCAARWLRVRKSLSRNGARWSGAPARPGLFLTVWFPSTGTRQRPVADFY